MDSANSGSLQSSSGGDDDATATDSISSFFNTQNNYAPATHVTSFNPPPPSPPPPPPPPPSFFDPLASYFDNLSRSTNPDPIWPKETVLRSDNLISSTQPSSSSAVADCQPNQISARNPRKRTRASRRAPTTVLTTDTSNFRAMVQEFTGIPSPPLGAGAGAGGGSSSSSVFFPRTRLDLFGSRMDAPPPYLLRPLAQKIKNGSDVMTASSSGGGSYHIPSPNLGLFTTNLSFGSSLKYPSDNPDPGLEKAGSLELPITTTVRKVNDDVRYQLGGITASFDGVNSSSGKDNGEGPFGWADGLGLGADAVSAGAPAPSTRPAGANNSHHTHQRPQNLGFAHQQIG